MNNLELKPPVETKIILIAGYLSAGEYGCFGYCHYPDDWHSVRIYAATSYLFSYELEQLELLEQGRSPLGPFVPEQETAWQHGAAICAWILSPSQMPSLMTYRSLVQEEPDSPILDPYIDVNEVKQLAQGEVRFVVTNIEPSVKIKYSKDSKCADICELVTEAIYMQITNTTQPISLQVNLNKILNHADCQFPLIEVFDKDEANSKDIQHEFGRNWRPHRTNEIFIETMYPIWSNNAPLQSHNRYTIVIGSGPFGIYAVYCDEELKFVVTNPNEKWWKDFETRKIDLNPENAIQYEILD